MNLPFRYEAHPGMLFRTVRRWTSTSVAERAHGRTPGPVYAFVPAHGDSRAGVVQEHLGRTWSEGFGLAVLLVDFAPQGRSGVSREGRLDRCTFTGADMRAVRKMVASVRTEYDVICVDLTGAPEAVADAILNLAHSVFLVSDSARRSLEMARTAVARLEQLKLVERVALLMRRTAGGVGADLAEDLAGAPLCGLVETPEQLLRLARWLALPQPAFAETLSA